MIRPLFSICIPNYNYAQYIGLTIQSVLNQTFQDFEIIIADNASTDDSVRVVMGFKDARIRLIRNGFNVGFAPNLDRATEQANGQFIILLSSDDLMMPTMLERYAALIFEHRKRSPGNQSTDDNLMLFSGMEMIDSDGKVFDSRQARPWLRYGETGPKSKEFSGTAYFYSGIDVLRCQLPKMEAIGRFATTCVSHDLYVKVCGYHTIHIIDPDTYYAYKCLFQDPNLIYVEEPLVQYRVHNHNQAAQEKGLGAPKLFIDRYYYTIDFDQVTLSKVGLTREDMRDIFLTGTCGKAAIHNIFSGNINRAFQAFMIALATYPGRYLCFYYPYFLVILLIFGCIPVFVFNLVTYLKNNISYKHFLIGFY